MSWAWNPGQRSLKVIESGTIRYIGYGFLLVCPYDAPFLRYSTCNYTVTLKPGLGVIKVIGTDTDRSATYDFLLMFHSNHGPVFTVSGINGDFSRKSQKISHIRVFCAPAEGVPFGIGYLRSGSKKIRMMALPGRERSLSISSAVWIQSTNVTDGRTDRYRQTNSGRQQRPRLRIASSGKNHYGMLLLPL